MKILIASRVFPPSVGGVEMVTEMIAEAFAEAGHAVCVVTSTPTDAAGAEQDGARPYTVLRQPSAAALLRLVAACDVFVHNCITLRMVWPLLIVRRPWVVINQVWLGDDLRGRMKRALIDRAHSICISTALARAIRPDSAVIPNPYRDAVFRSDPSVARDRDLAVVARLVPDKGVDVAVRALALLKGRGQSPTLTIIGAGPAEPDLRALAETSGVAEQVRFLGALSPPEVARELNRHRIMVVPSRWDEPFGIVALEGIAAGCVVVGTRGGGLPEAIGPCGVTVPNGDAPAMADALGRLMADPAALRPYLDAAPAHLDRHRAAAIAARYIEQFQHLVPMEARRHA